MLHSQGISHRVISEELKTLMKRGLPHDLNLENVIPNKESLLLSQPTETLIKNI